MTNANSPNDSDGQFEEDARVLTPTAANRLIRTLLESEPELQSVWIEGEIFDLKFHSSGHIYFALKDSESIIRCTYFKGVNRLRRIELENGKKIRALGDISVFTKGGSYQLNVRSVADSGKGDVHERIRKIYEKLNKEGLFDDDRKRPLPMAPLTLGVATASTGAAIQDIIQVARSRFADINIVLAPCIVQGEEALTTVPAAIKALHDPKLKVDVIIAGRGGGSFDDLLCFNEEPIVRAFANSRIPIVAGVGHQIDHPLCELAADAVGATPSNAAELCVPIIDDLTGAMDHYVSLIRRNLKHNLDRSAKSLQMISRSAAFSRPASILHPFQYQLDQASAEIRHQSQSMFETLRLQIQKSATMQLYLDRSLQNQKHRLQLATDRLDTLSPLGTLRRGYAIVTDTKGNLIKSAKAAKTNETVNVRFADDSIEAVVQAAKK